MYCNDSVKRGWFDNLRCRKECIRSCSSPFTLCDDIAMVIIDIIALAHWLTKKAHRILVWNRRYCCCYFHHSIHRINADDDDDETILITTNSNRYYFVSSKEIPHPPQNDSSINIDRRLHQINAQVDILSIYFVWFEQIFNVLVRRVATRTNVILLTRIWRVCSTNYVLIWMSNSVKRRKEKIISKINASLSSMNLSVWWDINVSSLHFDASSIRLLNWWSLSMTDKTHSINNC